MAFYRHALGGAFLAASALTLHTPAFAQVEISISCGALGIELQICEEGAQAWANQTGNTVNIVSTPNSATERLALYQQLLAAEATDIDVFQIDVIWPGILGTHFIDLAPFTDGAEDAHFSAIVDNNTINGELKAMPWFTDAGILYYRTDLLEKHGRDVPVTWQELTETAQLIQDAERAEGNGQLWGFVWQGRAYEGLTCDALEWIDSFGGGEIVDVNGEITINNPQAVEAIDLAASWVGTISPEGVLNYAEEEARGVFQAGNAVFMRNWPYAWSLGQSEDSPVRGNIGVAALPAGGPEGQNTGTLGGWQLAVSRYSDNPEVAADLVMYLTSFDEQKRRAIVGSYNPTIDALYQDAEVLEAVPFFGSLYDTFTNAVARPSRVTGENYNRVSSEFWNAVHATLSGNGDAATNLAQLERSLERIRRGGW
ncbi:MAG: ABC transporter substrate-binding protein [Pseudomonadota bacterium]